MHVQARPAEAHRKNAYFGTITRHLLQGPPGTVPEDIASAEPDAAMSPMAAPGMSQSVKLAAYQQYQISVSLLRLPNIVRYSQLTLCSDHSDFPKHMSGLCILLDSVALRI